MVSLYRLAGDREALAPSGSGFGPSLKTGGKLAKHGDYVDAMQLPSGTSPPSGVVACDDLMAVGAISAGGKLRSAWGVT